VNQQTISQSEYTCQYLSYHPNAKVIGTQSSGADGDVSFILLPGGIQTWFTSLGWYYADGYQQQRNGVKLIPLYHQLLQDLDMVR
jgi:C-terminal processing protease CtpA/Prc